MKKLKIAIGFYADDLAEVKTLIQTDAAFAVRFESSKLRAAATHRQWIQRLRFFLIIVPILLPTGP